MSDEGVRDTRMWKVGTVSPITDGWGFHLTNEGGRPLVTFTYETRADAEAAATHVQAAVEKALRVATLATL